MGRNESHRLHYITDIAFLSAVNYIFSKNSAQRFSKAQNHPLESKAQLVRFLVNFCVKK